MYRKIKDLDFFILKRMFASSIFKNTSSLVILKGFDYIVPLVLVPFLFRMLGLKSLGIVYFAASFIAYFQVCAQYGFGYYSTYYIAKNIKRPRKINEAFSAALTVQFSIALVGFILMLAIINTFPIFSDNKMVYVYYYGIVFGTALMPTWFFQAIEKMEFITIIATTTRLASLLPILIFVRGPQDVEIVPICYSVGSLLACFSGLIIAHKKFSMRYYIPNFRAIGYHAKNSTHYFMSAVCTTIQSETGSFLLGIMGGPQMTAVYAIAQRIVNAYNSMISPLQTALFPYMVKHKNLSVFSKILKLAESGNIIMVTSLIIFAPFLVNVLFNSNDQEIIDVLRISLLMCYATIPAILLGYPVLGTFVSNKYVINTGIYSSIFYIVALIIMCAFNVVSTYSMAILLVVTEYTILFQRVYLLRGIHYLNPR